MKKRTVRLYVFLRRGLDGRDPFAASAFAAAPAPHKIAEQIYNQGIQTQMAVRYFKGEALEKTLDWASGELEGFMRN